ncbi:TonB family protein [Stenotrophomonas sp. PS02289]|uniref:energy transducer TonB n=1 Tax=Stenotrophomonas sp. PS02289 TaxID=2991422 RepID=UPI00249C24BD|nr:TonB family protein [Stenotrophomonas sp. PS02289]
MDVRRGLAVGKGLQRLMSGALFAMLAGAAGAAPAPQTEPPPPPPSYTPGSPDEPESHTVVLILDINADGSISKVELETSSGIADLDKAAMDAAAGWNFAHAVQGGQPMRARVPVKFPVADVAAKQKAAQNP